MKVFSIFLLDIPDIIQITTKEMSTFPLLHVNLLKGKILNYGSVCLCGIHQINANVDGAVQKVDLYDDASFVPNTPHNSEIKEKGLMLK